MKNILIISAVFPPEPVVSAMLSKDIADSLSKENDVMVLCPEPSRPEGFAFQKEIETRSYRVHHLHSFAFPGSKLLGRFRESYSFGVHCANYIRKNSGHIDCIYINSWPLFSQYIITRTSKKLNIPTVLHVQDIYPESLINKMPDFLKRLIKPVLLPVDKYILHNTKRVIGISPNMISYLSKSRKIDIKKFELIRNWQNDTAFLNYAQTSNNREKNEFVFMYVGSLSQSAGVDVLIKAFDKAKLSSSRLIVAGNGSDKQKCIDLTKNLETNNIEFCEVSAPEVPELQSQSDVLLLPLKKGIAKTATPSKLTAYLLSSKPVIACVETESDVAEILKGGQCGFVVEPENEKALTLKMKELYDMERVKLQELGKNGREYALLNLSKKANLQKVVSLIESLV